MAPRLLFLAGLLICPVAAIAGQGAVPVSGTMVYTQDFDALGTAPVAWANDATVPGWYAQINGGATPAGTVQVSDGTQGTLNGLLNLGAAGQGERALGSRAASAGNNINIAYGVQFLNAGTAPLQVSRFTYTGELWRSNSSSGGRAETWSVYYTRTPSLLTDLESDVVSPTPGFDQFLPFVPAANWTSPNNLPPDTGKNGNDAANRVTISVMPNIGMLYPGQYLTFKWTDTNLAGNDGFQALDNVTVEFTSLAGVPGLPDALFQSNADSTVYSIAPQPDGKVVIGGDFTSVGGAPRNKTARLGANGLPDSGFTTAGGSSTAYSVAALAGGSVLAARESAGGNLLRYHADGTLDAAFTPYPNNKVAVIIPQADGLILLGGSFFSVGNGGAYTGAVARIDAGGAFVPGSFPNVNLSVDTLATGADGKVIAGGGFNRVGTITRRYLARINPNGKLDEDFLPLPNAEVRTVALQPDGKCLIAGDFTSINGEARNKLARVNADGTLDPGFNPASNGPISTMALQTDGRILVGGDFTAIAGAQKRYLARLNSEGTLDAGFNPALDSYVMGISLQPDGKVLVGGAFVYISELSRPGIARLNNGPATQSLTVDLPHRVQWLRGGTSPEVDEVRFELSTDKGNSWTPLGPGTRFAGGWEFGNSGTILPESGHLRARARIPGGFHNGSSGLVETTMVYEASPRERWRFAHFGIYSNTGDAADNADPDKDELENLVEYAFALNPGKADAAELPEWENDDGVYVLNFSQPVGVHGVTYTAEYSATMSPGSWLPAMNAFSPPHYTFYTLASGQRLYLRVRVTAP